MKKEKNKQGLLLVFILLGIGFLGGFLIGIIYQQTMLTASIIKFGESIEGNTFNLEINLNETKLVEALQQELFQGPVRPETNVSHFRETGIEVDSK